MLHHHYSWPSCKPWSFSVIQYKVRGYVGSWRFVKNGLHDMKLEQIRRQWRSNFATQQTRAGGRREEIAERGGGGGGEGRSPCHVITQTFWFHGGQRPFLHIYMATHIYIYMLKEGECVLYSFFTRRPPITQIFLYYGERLFLDASAHHICPLAEDTLRL